MTVEELERLIEQDQRIRAELDRHADVLRAALIRAEAQGVRDIREHRRRRLFMIRMTDYSLPPQHLCDEWCALVRKRDRLVDELECIAWTLTAWAAAS